MKKSKYPFPQGKIQKVNEIINQYLRRSVLDQTLRRNIAYTFQFINVVDWLLEETDICLTAREQTVKYGIIAVNSIMESVIRDYLGREPSITPAKGVEKNIGKLRLKKPNPVPLRIVQSLKFVHRKREKIHLHLCGDELEYNKYKKEDYIKCKQVIYEFIEWIKKAEVY